jgi:hypothetical protein
MGYTSYSHGTLINNIEFSNLIDEIISINELNDLDKSNDAYLQSD